jgi:hypothetical protein
VPTSTLRMTPSPTGAPASAAPFSTAVAGAEQTASVSPPGGASGDPGSAAAIEPSGSAPFGGASPGSGDHGPIPLVTGLLVAALGWFGLRRAAAR